MPSLHFGRLTVLDAIGPCEVFQRIAANADEILSRIRTVDETSLFTTSVCTGALILGATGLLDALTATTHWSAYDLLAKPGATPVETRVVQHLDKRIITAAGVSGGIGTVQQFSRTRRAEVPWYGFSPCGNLPVKRIASDDCEDPSKDENKENEEVRCREYRLQMGTECSEKFL